MFAFLYPEHKPERWSTYNDTTKPLKNETFPKRQIVKQSCYYCPTNISSIKSAYLSYISL